MQDKTKGSHYHIKNTIFIKEHLCPEEVNNVGGGEGVPLRNTSGPKILKNKFKISCIILAAAIYNAFAVKKNLEWNLNLLKKKISV